MNIENWADIRELVRMSIGTDKGAWWADPAFGSDLWLLRQSGKTTGETALALRRMILEATAWLVADGLAQKIECVAARSGKDRIIYTVTVHHSGTDSFFITGVWDAV
ncbi:MAG: phage GP46 family protein [Treponema sp.]|jgi:phage gp46-like protein|nr:phage GP46 family protein [Treponema sp.]